MTEANVKLQPWELAKKEGKTVVLRVVGPMIAVYYPYRKGGDLYVAGDDGPDGLAGTVHCCQDGCGVDIPGAKFIEHVNGHNRHFKRYPDLIIDQALVNKGGAQ
jgi:hypothetical protein